ncbi:MAG: hypothetical protein ACREOE_08935 [Gemmatimonadales bacterium]
MLYVEADGTGVPMRTAETEGRDGKDGQARTREIKLARLFTVSAMDAAGHPVTDPGSSSYVATFDGKDAFAVLAEAEYLRRGGEHFRQVVAIGDGAAWIWTMAQALYPCVIFSSGVSWGCDLRRPVADSVLDGPRAA